MGRQGKGAGRGPVSGCRAQRGHEDCGGQAPGESKEMPSPLRGGSQPGQLS